MQTNKLPETGRERFKRLKAHLAAERDARSAAASKDIERCGNDWKDNRFTCEFPVCPDCKRRNSARRAREAQLLFRGLGNDDVIQLSVVSGGAQSPAEVLRLLKKAQDATKYRRDVAMRASAAWRGTCMIGYHEVDALAGYHIPHLAPDRATLLPQLAPISLHNDAPTYVATYHALFYLNGLDPAEVRYTFGQQWKLPGQVDVEPLRSWQTFDENVGGIASYSTKFSSVTKLSLKRRDCVWLDPWPISWDASLYGHLYTMPVRNAFERMRFSIGLGRVEKELDESSEDYSDGLMPFACSSTREPMSNILYGYAGAYRHMF